MMTSAQIAIQLGVQQVNINHMASERLDNILFESDPMPNIYYNNGGTPPGFLPEGVTFTNSDFYKHEIMKTFPEATP